MSDWNVDDTGVAARAARDDAKSQGAQRFICPQCFDDKHHIPGDNHCLQGQKKEAMGIARLNQLESKRLREENEALRGRVAEFANSCVDLSSGIIGASREGPIRAFILREQAEAVEVLAQRLQEAAAKADEGPDESDTACTLIIAKSIALKESQRLRQRADEIERGGL